MLNLIMAIVIGITSLTGLVFLLRLLLNFQSGTDRYFTRKHPRISKGFQWGLKIPYKVGEVLQFYFYSLMGKKHYTNYSSWPVKVGLLISVFLFMAFITKRTFVGDYYSFKLASDDGFNPYLHGDTILWFLHMVNLAYLGLIVLVSIDSVRMMGWFALVRIGLIAFTIFISAVTSLLSFSILVILSFFYLAFKVVMFFFRSRHHIQRERKSSFITKYYVQFLEVKNQFDSPDIDNSRIRERKPRVSTRLEHYDDNIRRLRSDG